MDTVRNTLLFLAIAVSPTIALISAIWGTKKMTLTISKRRAQKLMCQSTQLYADIQGYNTPSQALDAWLLKWRQFNFSPQIVDEVQRSGVDPRAKPLIIDMMYLEKSIEEERRVQRSIRKARWLLLP